MKFPVIRAPWLPVDGMALFPVILVKSKQNRSKISLINHERIHLQQQMEMLILPFYLLYLLNYMVNLLIYFNHDCAYRQIIFEREAYQNDKNEQYLRKRKTFNWLRYWKAL